MVVLLFVVGIGTRVVVCEDLNLRVVFDLDKGKFVCNPRTHREMTGKTCTCHACRRKYGILSKEDRMINDADKQVLKDEKGLEDIVLFCCVFPEGLVGDCGFRWFGFCEVFEDGCVRWNELGDRMDYSVGEKNPFR